MKRFITIAFAALLVAAALCVSAAASGYDAVAEELSAIGMLQGTGDGFDLDRQPNRAEVATMLVRLYGAEEEAKADFAAGKISSPFTDVSWDAPYVAWLYSKGMTSGISETEFGSANKCSAHDYNVFLLRALGYKDNTDFAYADACKFAAELGFYSPMFENGTFLRDNLAAVTYVALSTNVKGKDVSLLQSLVDSGAVSKTDAKPMLDKFALYYKLNDIMSVDYDAIDAGYTMLLSMQIPVEGETMVLPVTVDGYIRVQMPDKVIMKVAGEFSMNAGMNMGAEMYSIISAKAWIKDGFVYVKNGIGDAESKMKISMNEVSDMIASFAGTSVQSGSSGLANISEIKENDDGSMTFVISSKPIINMLTASLGEVSSELGEDMAIGMDISDITVILYTEKGLLSGIEEVFDIFVHVETGEEIPSDVAASVDAFLTITSVNDAVKIEYPDFSDYVEVSLDDFTNAQDAPEESAA